MGVEVKLVLGVATGIVLAVTASACRQAGSARNVSPEQTHTSPYANCSVSDALGSYCDPSLVELLSRPEWYDGRLVVVRGVLDPEPETFALFASEDAYNMYLARSAVLLSVNRELYGKNFQPVAGGWVSVTGKFVARGRGAEGKFGGTIVAVSDIFPYKSSRVHPAGQ